MNNYRILKPSTFLDAIGQERLKYVNEMYQTNDISTQAELYQRFVEQHKEHWDSLGKPITEFLTDVAGEPFILEKHNTAVRLLEMDLNVLYNEYPKILPLLSNNYNYNLISNEALNHRIDFDYSVSTDDLPEPAIPQNQGQISLVIRDNLLSGNKLDTNYTTAEITNGTATLPKSITPYNLTSNASVYVINQTRFMKDGELRQGIPGLESQAKQVDIEGLETNGFPGAVREGRSTYGVGSDANGNTAMQEIIEPVDGQDIHINPVSTIDNNLDTWYATELTNVRAEELEKDHFGFEFAKPNNDIRWAVGAENGEVLKLGLLIEIKSDVPANRIVVNVHNTLPQPANVDKIMIKSKAGRWISVDQNELVITNQSDVEEPNLTASVDANLTSSPVDNINLQILNAMPLWAQVLLMNNTTYTANPALAAAVREAYNRLGMTFDPTVPFKIPEGFTPDVSSNPMQASPNVYNNTSDGDVEIADDYYYLTTSPYPDSLSNQFVQLEGVTKIVPQDKTNVELNFENQWVSSILVLFSQTRSYACKIIHRYYEHISVTRESETTQEAPGLFDKNTKSHTEVTHERLVERVAGEDLPASALFAGIGVGGTSNTSIGIGNAIQTIATTVGSTMAMASIGGIAAPIIVGIGLIAGGIWGGATTTSSNKEVIQDETITGLELMDGWKYIIGVDDINIYGDSFEISAEIISEIFRLPFELKEIYLTVSQTVPRKYYKGEYFKHYISIDGGNEWLQINPKNYPAINNSSPRKYLINPEDRTNSRLTQESIITTEKKVNTVKYRCTITRPDEFPYNLYTPALTSYSLHVSGIPFSIGEEEE